MTDEQLVVRLQDPTQRDEGFRLLVDAYGNRLFQHLYTMLNNKADAEDVLQNVLIKVYRGIGNFKAESKLFTWLYRIATNEALTHLARTKRKQGWLMSTNEMTNKQAKYLVAEVPVSATTIEEKLNTAITRLPPKQRSVFNLRYFEEKTYQEIANVTGTSIGSLKASYHHAVKKIEAYLKT